MGLSLEVNDVDVSELSIRVSNLDNIENILNSPLEELGVPAEDVEPNSQ